MSHDILIVDDEADIRDLISGILNDEGYQTRTASDGIKAIEAINSLQPQLVVLDVWLGDSERDGLKILDIIKRDHPFVPVVMISGHSTIETAVQAIKKGAYDFIEKPFQIEKLLVIIARAIESSSLKRENAELKVKAGMNLDWLGNSPIINQVKQTIEKVAPSNSRVMLVGPVGCGKEALARQIHLLSKRNNGPFITVNCASIHPDHIESELFGTYIAGVEKNPRKIGALEKANQGTLFLDEISVLPLPTQAKLLRFLNEQSFSRLGSNDKIRVDVRVITGSSVDLQLAIAAGDLREDLSIRLSVVPINIPSLKDRIGDIPSLANHFMNELAKAQGAPIRRFSEDALILLQTYPWPGNLSQLKNVIEGLLVKDKDIRAQISKEDLPPEIRQEVPLTNNNFSEIVAMPLRQAREQFEREYLVTQVQRFEGNISRTARFIGMERSALHRKLKVLGAYDKIDNEES